MPFHTPSLPPPQQPLPWTLADGLELADALGILRLSAAALVWILVP